MEKIIELSKGERTRRALVEAAQKLFSSRGYAATSVDDIVSSIGLTSGVFYVNFKSKEALLKEAIETRILQVKGQLLAQRAGESSEQWLRRILHLYLSPRHRDDLETSCFLTTMGQELQKLGLAQKVGLGLYAEDFEEAIRNKLERLAPGKGKWAPALMSICVGGIQFARLIESKDQSDLYLRSIRDSALDLIFSDAPESLFAN